MTPTDNTQNDPQDQIQALDEILIQVEHAGNPYNTTGMSIEQAREAILKLFATNKE